MTDEELVQLLADLESLLRDLDLDFIVNQERVLAAEGISTLAENLGDRARDIEYVQSSSERMLVGEAAETATIDWGGRNSFRRPVLNKTDVLVRPLTTRERLAILLDLIEVTTAGTLAMERFVQVEFGETVTFEDPPEAELLGRTSQPWQTDSVDGDRTAHAVVVVGVVDELRARAGIPRGDWLRRSDANDAEYAWAPTKEDR